MATAKIESMQFKRGKKDDLLAVLVGTSKPKAGEPIFETDTNLVKIGDGEHDYKDLPYLADNGKNILRGYLLNNEFYADSTYTVALSHLANVIYLNANGDDNLWAAYKWENEAFVKISGYRLPPFAKLYEDGGQNIDGSMTQKAITDGVHEIKFALETSADEDGDGEPENVLILDLPWD